MPPSHPAPPSQDSEMEMAPRSNASSSVPADEFAALEDDDDKYEMNEKVFIKNSNFQAQVTGLNDRTRLSDLMTGTTTLVRDHTVETLQRQNAAHDAAIKELQQHNTSQQQQNDAQDSVIKGLQQQYKDLQQQNDAKIKELQQQNAALREHNTNQQIQNAAAINVLQQQNAILQQQNTALQQQNTRLRQENAHQNTVIKGLEQQNALLQVHNQASARRFDNLVETLQSMQTRLDEMSR
jgi:hypothetical protein